MKEVKLNAAGGNHCLNFKLSHEGQTPSPARIRNDYSSGGTWSNRSKKNASIRWLDGGLLVVRLRTEDLANINVFSTMVFIILMTLSTHGHGMTFQDRCLGFPKPPCFPKFMKMVAQGGPLADGLDEFRSLGQFGKTPKIPKNLCKPLF